MALDFFTIGMIIASIMAIAFVYIQFFYKKGESIIVSYSEKVGDNIIEHGKEYIASLNEKRDIMHISKIKLKRPIPPRKVMIPTLAGKKKVYLLKIDVDRYAFRIPSLKNQVFTYQRDLKGNIVKDSRGKAILKKHKWTLCDDVVEPDVKHWEEYMQEEVRRRHKITASIWEKWGGPITLAVIFMFAVIMLNQSTKRVEFDKKMIMENAQEMQSEAQRTQRNLNNLMERISGTRELEQKDREIYYNESVT